MDVMALATSKQDGIERFDALSCSVPWLFCSGDAFLALAVLYAQLSACKRHQQRTDQPAAPPWGALVGCVTSRAEGVLQSRLHQPQLAVITETLEDGSGWELIRDLKQQESTPACLLVVKTISRHKIKSLIASGADGILAESLIAKGNLLLAVETVLAGGCYLDPDLKAFLRQKSEAGTSHLTDRQLQIMAGVSQGHTDRVIANTLQISEDTLRSHLKQIFQKLGTSNRTAAAVKLLQRGELPL
jgi:DNA-binding NarL/FixJ family response regulator